MLARVIQHTWAFAPQYPYSGSGILVPRRRFATGTPAAIAAFTRTHPPVRYRTTAPVGPRVAR